MSEYLDDARQRKLNENVAAGRGEYAEAERVAGKRLAITSLGDGSQGIGLLPVMAGLTTPTCLAYDNEGQIHVSDQTGQIYRLGDAKPWLSIGGLFKNLKPSKEDAPRGLNPEYDERGLLGFCFDPKLSTHFYTYHSVPSADDKMNHDSVLQEWMMGPTAPSPGEVILRIPQEGFTHNGGNIKFGPDGMLYVPTGDGGCCGDKHGEIGNAQSLSSLKGKILRLDVSGVEGYRIPKGNPFIKTKGALPEIWTYGLRNPWQISFDHRDRMWVANVGEGGDAGGGWETIYMGGSVLRGANCGWRIKEGTHWYDKELGGKLGVQSSDITDPVHEYDHNTGRAVIGGYVYNGDAIPELKGHYVFGDWAKTWADEGTGKLYYLAHGSGRWPRREFSYPGGKATLGYFVLALGEGPDKELYVMVKKTKRLDERTGMVLRINPA